MRVLVNRAFRQLAGSVPWSLIVGVYRSVFVPVLVGTTVGEFVALVLDFYLFSLPSSSAGVRPLPWVLPVAEEFVLLVEVLA